jgi:hypothetical protein
MRGQAVAAAVGSRQLGVQPASQLTRRKGLKACVLNGTENLLASPDCVPLRAWEVGWGAVPLAHLDSGVSSYRCGQGPLADFLPQTV